METTQITGKVAQANEKGLKLEGADSWLNLSKWAQDVVMPAKGAQVALTLDKAGFIRSISPWPPAQEHRPPTTNGQKVTTTSSPTTTQSKPPAPDWPPPWEGDAEQQPGNERRISRQACLNTAVNILASGGRPTDAKEVVALAARLEAWVYRPVAPAQKEG